MAEMYKQAEDGVSSMDEEEKSFVRKLFEAADAREAHETPHEHMKRLMLEREDSTHG